MVLERSSTGIVQLMSPNYLSQVLPLVHSFETVVSLRSQLINGLNENPSMLTALTDSLQYLRTMWNAWCLLFSCCVHAPVFQMSPLMFSSTMYNHVYHASKEPRDKPLSSGLLALFNCCLHITCQVLSSITLKNPFRTAVEGRKLDGEGRSHSYLARSF